MKEESIAKINKFGKIASRVTTFVKVCLIIAMVGVSIAIVVMAALPKDLVKFEINGNAKIQVDPSTVNVKISDDDMSKIKDEVQSGDLTVGTTDYQQVKVEKEDELVVVTGTSETKVISLRDLVAPLVTVLVAVIAVFVTTVFAGKLFKAIRDCETPFSVEVIGRLNKFAYSFIPWIFLPSIAESCMEAVFTRSTNIKVSINLETLLIVLTIFALVNIFKYGAILQQESDETL